MYVSSRRQAFVYLFIFPFISLFSYTFIHIEPSLFCDLQMQDIFMV